MEVLYWQIGIFASVAAVTLVYGARKGLLMASGWTLVSVFTAVSVPVIALQIVVAWLAYGVTAHRGQERDRALRRRRESAALKTSIANALGAYDARVRANAEVAIEHSRHEVIREKQHYLELSNAIMGANASITIVSGWIRKWVVDRKLIALLREALERGVNVFIGYGFEDDGGSESGDAFDAEARKKLDKLAALASRKRGWGRLTILESPVRENILIKDSDYVICGSNDWLCGRKFRHSKPSVKIWDPDLALQMTARYRPAGSHGY